MFLQIYILKVVTNDGKKVKRKNLFTYKDREELQVDFFIFSLNNQAFL